MKFTTDVGRNIVELRNHFNLKQEELGTIAKRSAKTISSWENGTRSPQIKTLKKIAEHFGIDPIALSGESRQERENIILTNPTKVKRGSDTRRRS